MEATNSEAGSPEERGSEARYSEARYSEAGNSEARYSEERGLETSHSEATSSQKKDTAALQEAGIRCICADEPEYPEKLRNYPDMPQKLYVKGFLPDCRKPSIAIVGARMCSPYGRIQAFRYAKTLSNAGIQVISGLAYGIDAEGHKGGLEGKTPTFAVLGNGVDICYPARNRCLYERILREKGGIISEYPPETPAKNYHFPARNRIISALSDVILVVEAKEKSGSLITARCALEQGKSVYALPGAVTEELSKGCHKLIYDGAGIAYSPEILLSEWGITEENMGKSKEKNKLVLASDLNLVYSCLDLRPKSLDFFIRETGFPAWKVSNLLLELTLLGLARETCRNYYIRGEMTPSGFGEETCRI